MGVRKTLKNLIARARPIGWLTNSNRLRKDLHDGKRQDICQIACGSCYLVMSGYRFHR